MIDSGIDADHEDFELAVGIAHDVRHAHGLERSPGTPGAAGRGLPEVVHGVIRAEGDHFEAPIAIGGHAEGIGKYGAAERDIAAPIRRVGLVKHEETGIAARANRCIYAEREAAA